MEELLASQLYAESQGAVCFGSFECYWCGAPCHTTWPHGQPPPMIGRDTKTKLFAKRPGNHFICVGCWLWQRKRITVTYLDGGFKDGQCPMEHSWLITKQDAFGLKSTSYKKLYDILLAPPLKFSLSFLTEPNLNNLLQFALVNNNAELQVGTPLAFTVNNIPHTYTVYELTHALKNGPEGTDPGVQALIRILGPHKMIELEIPDEKRGRGRPVGAYLEDARALQKPVKKKG